MKSFYHKFSLVLLSFIMIYQFGFSQKVSYDQTFIKGIKKLKTVNLSNIEDDYLAQIESLEAPSVSGNKYKEYLKNLKEELEIQNPKKDTKIIRPRNSVNPPELINGFGISGIQPGSPLDNHLAMSNEWVVSAGNFWLSVNSKDGTNLKTITLQSLASELGISAQAFDPRLAYDPAADRYVLVFLAGFDSANTFIVAAFSATNDPTQDWHLYSIAGNPNELDQWTDYPMINFTNEDLFLTINLLRDNQSWQLGFVETLVWQMDKNTGFAGEELAIKRFENITFDGKPIRNLCPAESATFELQDECYFISSRNFAQSNDTFFLVKVDGPLSDPNTALTVDFVTSNDNYGVPPTAGQFFGRLETNDARVLEAFIIDNEIQFVGNTKNFENNKAGIYHGIIKNVEDPDIIELNHIIGEDFEVGYPGITYTGDGIFERDAIITFNHTAKTRFPGMSAIYSVPDAGYSEIIEVKAGTGYVDMNGGSSIERWGDYFGTQRDHANPEEVWVAGYLGSPQRVNIPYVARLARPQVSVGTKDISDKLALKAYPNPMIDRINIEFEIPYGAEFINVHLTTIDGKVIDNIYDSIIFKNGKSKFSFNTSNLMSGSYFVNIIVDGKIIKSEKIVK